MKNEHFDYLIIGGGFAGCSLAYYLAKSRAKVLLVEAKSICSGTSAACAGRAQLIESETIDYLKIVRHGFSKIPDLGRELGVDFDWQDRGHLTLLYTESDWEKQSVLVQNLQALGISAEMLTQSEVRMLEPNINLKDCLGASYSQEGHLDPFKFCFGFANAAKKSGVTMMLNAPVYEFIQQNNQIVGVKVGHSAYYAARIIIAAGAWSGAITEKIGQSIPILHTHAEAIVSEKIPSLIHHHIGVSGFYEAVHGNQRSVTLGFGQHPNGSLVISNAIQPEVEIHRESTSWGMSAIAKMFLKVLPQMDQIRILRTWAAPSPFTPDHLPVFGNLPDYKNVFIAAGFHLAIPTIPYFAEKISESLIESENMDSIYLQPFSLNRFVSNRNLMETS